MTEELNHETLDIAAVLAGIAFPEHKVHVYFNETAALTIHNLKEAVKLAENSNQEKEAKKLQKELDTLLKNLEGDRYTIHLKGIPEAIRQNIFEKLEKDFPEKRNVFGQPEPFPERDREFTFLLFQAYVVAIEGPTGARAEVTEESLRNLIEHAPSNVIAGIHKGVEELVSGVKSGFEFAASEVSFL